MLIVWVFAVNEGAITKLLDNKVLLWLGNISGFTFLIHQVIMRGLRMYVIPHDLGVWYTPCVVASTFVVTIACTYLYLYGRKLIGKNKA